MRKPYPSDITRQYIILGLVLSSVFLLFVLTTLWWTNLTLWQNASTFASAVLGCLVSYYVMVIQGLQTRPRLQIRPFPALKAAGDANRGKLLECLMVNLEHQRPGVSWVARQPARKCHGTISFRYDEKHARSLQLAGPGRIEFWNSASKGNQRLSPGGSLEIDIAHRYVGGRELYVGNNHYKLETEKEATPANDLDKWPVESGDYLVEIRVYDSSLGPLASDLIRLRVGPIDFRLEEISWWRKYYLFRKIIETESGDRELPELFQVIGASGHSRRVKHVQRFFLYSRNVHKIINQSQWGMTPLSYACWLSDVRLARLLIWLGAKLNPENPHWTPLLATCAKGNSALVKLLIEREADVNLPGYSKWTPLMVAVQEGHEDVVEILLRAGADVDATNEQGLREKDYSNSERILQMLDSALPRS